MVEMRWERCNGRRARGLSCALGGIYEEIGISNSRLKFLMFFIWIYKFVNNRMYSKIG